LNSCSVSYALLTWRGTISFRSQMRLIGLLLSSYAFLLDLARAQITLRSIWNVTKQTYKPDRFGQKPRRRTESHLVRLSREPTRLGPGYRWSRICSSGYPPPREFEQEALGQTKTKSKGNCIAVLVWKVLFVFICIYVLFLRWYKLCILSPPILRCLVIWNGGL
jgi:hypothetical protein